MEKNIHTGHRGRTKQAFRDRGFTLEGMPDHLVLELLLFFAKPQGDVNPLAHGLMERFETLHGVFDADYEKLLEVNGVAENTATLLKLIPALCKRYSQSRADLSGIYQDTWQFRELLEPEFYGARNEMVYLVCLDGKHKFIACRKIGEGVADAAAITTRKVMETALGCNASVVVLAHNHISGLALPSAEDVMTTRQLTQSLRQVGIRLFDHFIVVDGDMVSMRESGYLEGM